MTIESLLDTDLYKFTMGQVVLHKFPAVEVEYEFKCRNEDVNLTNLQKEIENEIICLSNIRFKPEELKYLQSLRFIKKDFIEFLRNFKLNPNLIKVSEENGQLAIQIKGPWISTIFFEVPVLAIVNEVYFRRLVGPALSNNDKFLAKGMVNLENKIKLIRQHPEVMVKFADFGTRRRFSRKWQDQVIKTLTKQLPDSFIGTSNVYFAMKYNLKPIGTMAHEFLQAAQALVRLRDSQKFALENWVQEYRGDLGIALSDVVGMDAFLRDFDLYFCKLFDGARHDSGDPIVWGEKLIAHYQKMGIDPITKMAVFSDGLNFQKALDLAKHFSGKIKTSFGIGTNLTNDFPLQKALNIVIKMTKCEGQPVAKISDSSGKQMCKDENYLEYLKKVFQI